MRAVLFDLDVLRSFVAGVDLGSFSKAADRVGRSTSAVSAQLRKLEEQAGTAIFRKSGRGLALTEAGETMLSYARRLLELNAEAGAAVRGVELEGWVRLGVQEDFGEGLLPKVLARFARAHPKVRIEARVARNLDLLERVSLGRLDLALAWDDGSGGPQGEKLAELDMRWIGPAGREIPSLGRGEPLQLAVFEVPCLFRTAATAVLDEAEIPWRVAFTGPGLSALWAAAAAGIGVTVRTAVCLPDTLCVLGPGEGGIPPLARSLPLCLHRADPEPGPAAARLAEILSEAVKDEWRPGP